MCPNRKVGLPLTMSWPLTKAANLFKKKKTRRLLRHFVEHEWCATARGGKGPHRAGAGSARHHRRDKSPTNQPLQQVATAEDATRQPKRQQPHRHRTVRLVQLITHPSSLIVQEKGEKSCLLPLTSKPTTFRIAVSANSRPPGASSSTRLYYCSKKKLDYTMRIFPVLLSQNFYICLV